MPKKPLQDCLQCKKPFYAKGIKRPRKFCSQKCAQDAKVAGRELFDGRDEKEIISKLREVWKFGGTDEEASFYADISNSTLSRYLKANPDIAEIRDRLRQYPKLKARKTVVNSLDTTDNAWKYLEKKAKDEFGDRPQPANVVNVTIGERTRKNLEAIHKGV